MTARQEVARCLAQWRELTQAQAAAIQAAAWSNLRGLHSAKVSLQAILTDCLRRWTAEAPGDIPADPAQHPFRTEVNRLLSLETRNGALLAARKRRLLEEKETLASARRNLQLIRRSYARKRTPAWQSYS